MIVNKSREINSLNLEMSQVTRVKSIFNRNQIQKLWNSTPTKHQYKRPAKGGGTWSYVRVAYVRKVLDSVFGFDWDFTVETTIPEIFEVATKTKSVTVKGTLTGRVVDDSGRIREIKKTQVGRADVKFKTETINNIKKIKIDQFGNPELLDFGNDIKAAFSDCLKKCASLFGVAADIYERDDFFEVTIIDSDEDKSKKVKKQIEKVKTEIKKEINNDK